METKLQHKQECERRALDAVISLLEESCTQHCLTQAAQFLTPSHYADVVEERHILKLCAYPGCSKYLSNIPKQRYRLCTKTNRVFDLLDRKKFCSDDCQRASKHYEQQLSSVPVWSREWLVQPLIQLRVPNHQQSLCDNEIIGKYSPSDQLHTDNIEDIDATIAEDNVYDIHQSLANFETETENNDDDSAYHTRNSSKNVVYGESFDFKNEITVFERLQHLHISDNECDKISGQNESLSSDSDDDDTRICRTSEAQSINANSGIKAKRTSRVDYLKQLMNCKKNTLATIANINNDIVCSQCQSNFCPVVNLDSVKPDSNLDT